MKMHDDQSEAVPIVIDGLVAEYDADAAAVLRRFASSMHLYHAEHPEYYADTWAVLQELLRALHGIDREGIGVPEPDLDGHTIYEAFNSQMSTIEMAKLMWQQRTHPRGEN